MKSEKIDQLATALSKAQIEMPPVPLNSINPFLKNKYADLGEMIKTATPVLSKHGLAVSQQVVTELDRIGVTSTLMHNSGQWLESTVTLPLGDEKGKSNAQVAGSVITYLRRYSFGAIVGLYTDEDTDGSAPASKPENKPASKPTAKAETPNLSMTLETAQSVKNSQGISYGEIPTEKLNYMANTLSKVANKTDDHLMKIDAIKVILQARTSSGA